MYNYLARNGQSIAFGVGVIFTVVFLVSVFSGLDAFTALPEAERGTTSIFNIGLYASFLLIIAGVLAMLIFGVMHVASDFKGSVKGIAGLGAILVIFLIGKSMGSDDTPIQAAIDTFKITDGQSSIISGAIMTGIALALLAAAAFVLSEIRNFFK